MDDKLKNQSVQTYVADMTKALESNKAGIIKSLIHEEERHAAEKKNLSPESKRNRIFLVIGSFLFLAALGILGSYIVLKEDISTTPVAQEFKPIIFLDETGFAEIAGFSKEQIAASVVGEANASNLKEGHIEGIYLTENKKIVGLRRFLALGKTAFFPGEEIYVSDNFILGAVEVGAPDIFFFFQVRSFSDAFPLFRAWEPKMFNDLHGYYGVTLTPETKYLLEKPFEDSVLENRNVRMLTDKSGEIILLYLFANENTVIISGTEAGAREIIDRLSRGQIKK